MTQTLAMVGFGGALGAMLRYLTGVLILRLVGHGPFPVAILTVNVIGSALMGLFVVAAAHRGLTPLSPLIMTGFLGGFTTFSAFSLETVTLIERGDMGLAGLYVGLSVVGSVGALFLAMAATRAVMA